MKKHIIALASLSLAVLFSSAQTTQRISAADNDDHALIYTLPNTVLDLVIETEIVVKRPGEFAQYASKFLNDNNAILRPSQNVTVKSVTVVPRGVSNPDERFMVKFSSGNLPFMLLNDQNLPIAINTEKQFTGHDIKLPMAIPAQPTILETDAAKQAVSQEMTQSTSIAKKAELAAELIYSLREGRHDIITGQSDQSFPDGTALQLALDNINAQEAALTAMFLGTEQRHTKVSTIPFMPEDEVNDLVVARITSNGAVDANDLTGEPLYLSLAISEFGEMPVDKKGNAIHFPKNGFAYCIPGKALVRLSFDNKTMVESTFEIAQFGITYGLEPNLFTHKKNPMFLIMNPATGAIHELGPIPQEEVK